MKLYFASGNAHKHEEIIRIMDSCTILKPSVPCDFDETADTFIGNAEIKARGLYNIIKQPVLADDSGLVIPALGGEPGIYSARYGTEEAGRPLTQDEKNQLILSKMKGITDRRCYFVAALVVILDEERILSVQERFEGVISHEPAGSGGFGYDPIVYLPELERSVAELTEKEKDTLSHRGVAGAAMQRILQNYNI